jgi:hypothetical protein
MQTSLREVLKLQNLHGEALQNLKVRNEGPSACNRPLAGQSTTQDEGKAWMNTPGEFPFEVDVSMSASSCSCMLSSALPSSTPAAPLGV